MSTDLPYFAGVDGSPGGWVAVIRPFDGDTVRVAVFAKITELIKAEPGLAAIAIDMPIGLPERIIGPGRGPEKAVRGMLGQRQSSVFSVPVRSAVAETDYRLASLAALAGSEPPRKVSKQSFLIFPKIREVDEALRATPGLADRMIETHPEVVFRQIKGSPLSFPKKTTEGKAERRTLLLAAGVPPDLVESAPPSGAKQDDLIDAIACSWVAKRYALGAAMAWPDPFERDPFGLPMAIWT
ncbi:COG4923 Predicted nuclease (RNAse H fold) [Rhabdaerophilaceae bacterium]